jgi:hypothetical protein
MKHFVSTVMFTVLAAIGTAHAADEAPKTNSKMATCNKESSGKTGDERKAFMSSCLSAKPAAAAKPESKMTSCNKASAGKTGDERKAFMSTCLSAKPAA